MAQTCKPNVLQMTAGEAKRFLEATDNAARLELDLNYAKEKLGIEQARLAHSYIVFV